MRTFSMLPLFALVGIGLSARQLTAGDNSEVGPPPVEPRLSPDPGSTSPGKETTYRGKTVAQWVALAKNEHRPGEQASRVLDNLGTSAISALTVLLTNEDERGRQIAASALWRIGRLLYRP